MRHEERRELRLKRHKEQRELAAFYQEQIGHLYTPVIQAANVLPLFMATLAILYTTQEATLEERAIIFVVAIFFGLAVMMSVAYANQQAARLIEAEYLRAHRSLFGDAPPLTLVSFLLRPTKSRLPAR